MNSDFPKDRRRRCRGGSIDWNGLFDQYAAEGGTLQDFYYGSFQKLITSRIFRTFFWGSPGQVLLCLKSGHHGRLSRTHGPDVYLGFW